MISSEEYKKHHFLADLLIILVVYEMKVSESPAFKSLTRALQLSRQMTTLFIYDNSLKCREVESDGNWKIIYRHDPSNPGVSKAYNEGFAFAKSENKKWMLLIDQDTFFPNDLFHRYYTLLSTHKIPIIVPRLVDNRGVVSPFRFYLGSGHRQKKIPDSVTLSLKKYFFINSGLFIATGLFENAGKYDERLPLDFSDLSFVYRLRKRNDFFVLAEITCEHDLSGTRPATLTVRLNRFKAYLRASRLFKLSYEPWALMMPIRSLLRAIVLSIRHKNFQFLFLFFQ
jgi:GT2 family glycosyltransferase